MRSMRPTVDADRHPVGGGLRKQPLQERTRVMVQHVLDTATELVEEVGYEAVVGSPTLLLDRSGISRGSFYSFFETPERVLDELSYRTLLDSVANLEKALARRRSRKWTSIVDVLIDQYTAEHRVPLIRELWVRQNLTRRVRALDQLFIDEMAEQILQEFRKHASLFDKLTLIQCRVAIHALERLFQLAFAEDENGDAAVIAEARVMLVNYFAAYSDN